MFAESSSYFPTYSRTAIIYIGCIAFFFVALASLPYLKTDVSVRASANIRPASQVNTLRSIASGRVKEAYLTENKKVKEGDLLYVIESETLNEQEHFSQEKIALKETFIRDVEMVIAASKGQTTTAVPQDIKIIDNKPVFEVRCSLDKDFLQLKSGYKGFLKKGMTLQARFIVTQRSLWQLLYDKVDDWVNPNLK